jgi:predicted transcriptional regulator
MEENRNDFDVIADILRMTISGSKESEIEAKSSLNRVLFEKYIATIVLLKLVSVKRMSENFYQLTDRGLEFLRFYYGLRWLLRGEHFDFVLVNILTKLKKDKKPNYIT